MARVLMTNLISSISGRFGGGVFRNWKGLTVLSALPDSVANPSTVDQVNAREILGYCTKQWSGLTLAERGGWAGVADQLTEQWENFDNEVGVKGVCVTPRGPFTPLGALVSVHALLASVGDWDTSMALIAPPGGVGAPTQPTDVVVTQDPVSGVITVEWTDPAEWGQNAHAGNVRVWVRNENGMYHRQLAATAASGVQTVDLPMLRTSGGYESTVAPYWMFTQLDAVNAEGIRSAPSASDTNDLAEPYQP